MNVLGYGIVSTLGVGVDETAANLLAGSRTALRRDERLGGSVVAEVPLTNTELHRRVAARRPCRSYSRAELLSLVAVREAVRAAGVDLDGARCGLYCGTSLSATDALERAYERYCADGRGDAGALKQGDFSALVDTIADELGCSGPRLMVSTACSSSTVILKLAEADLRAGSVDVAVVFGVDPLTQLALLGFGSLQALARDEPRPFSVGEVGLALGEGAGCLVLAAGRGRRGIRLEAVGVSVDGYHPTAPDPSGEGMSRAMKAALGGDAKVDLVIAHGTGTTLNDAAEANALKAVFAENARAPYVISTKGATGHTLGGAGALNNVLACIALERGVVPESFNFTGPREGCDLRFPLAPARRDVDRVLANSFGFGGTNGSVVFSRRGVPRPPASDPRRVFVTRAGVITGYGIGLDRNFAAFERPVASDQRVADDVIRAATAKMRYGRKIDRLSQLALIAADDLRRAGGDEPGVALADAALFTGNGLPPLNCLEQFYSGYLSGGPKKVVPSLFTNTVSNACLGYMALEWGWKGPAFAIPQLTIASAMAIDAAWRLLRADAALEHAMAGGADEHNDTAVEVLRSFRLVGDGCERGTPFGTRRLGLSSGEGAGYLLLRAAAEAPADAAAELAYSAASSERCRPRFYPRAWPNLSALLEARRERAVPDLVVVNANGIPSVDEALRTSLAASLDASTALYSPLGAFGNLLGMNGFLGGLAALFALGKQRLPVGCRSIGSAAAPDREGAIRRVWVVTTKHGGAFHLMELERA